MRTALGTALALAMLGLTPALCAQDAGEILNATGIKGGLIDARVVSTGRYGKTREISSSFPTQTTEKLKKELCELVGV